MFYTQNKHRHHFETNFTNTHYKKYSSDLYTNTHYKKYSIDHLQILITKIIAVIKAGFKKQKVIHNFCEIATQFGKVIRNCES